MAWRVSSISEWAKIEREEYLAQVAEEERALGEGGRLGGGGIIDYLRRRGRGDGTLGGGEKFVICLYVECRNDETKKKEDSDS